MQIDNDVPNGLARAFVAGSERTALDAVCIGPADPNQRLVLSVYLKDPTALAGWRVARETLQAHRMAWLQAALDRLCDFADHHDLEITFSHFGRRAVQMTGLVSECEKAFDVRLHAYQAGGRQFLAYAGRLSVDAEISDDIEAVLGLDNRSMVTPMIAPADKVPAMAHRPNKVASLYDFPTTIGYGRGGCIALIELGGGYRASDIAIAAGNMDILAPSVTPIEVSGGRNAPGNDWFADCKVAADIQIAGSAAPGAIIAVYFAPNTEQGFVDAISTAIHDRKNAPSVLCIGYSAPEHTWSKQSVAVLNSILEDAAIFRMTVLAACDPSTKTSFPASNPLVVACGGSKIAAEKGQITQEAVWNPAGQGSTQDTSGLFAAPEYQRREPAGSPLDKAIQYRRTPDVVANADPNSGYYVVIDGFTEIFGGTSLATSLWGALFALFNEVCGHVGQPHDILYASVSAFRRVNGDDEKIADRTFATVSGWSACAGLGAPNGAALLGSFIAAR